MYRNIKKTVLITAICYGLIYFLISEQSANFLLASFIIVYVILYFLKQIFAKFLYKYSYRLAKKEFLHDKYTLVNTYCIVKYTPNEKLSVEENLTQKDRREKRMFTIHKYNKANIDKIWNEICCVFNSYTYFDTLSAYISKITPIKLKLVPTTYDINDEKQNTNESVTQTDNIKTKDTKRNKIPEINNETKKDSEFISMDEIRPDTYGIDNPETSKQDDYFVDLNNIRKVNKDE